MAFITSLLFLYLTDAGAFFRAAAGAPFLLKAVCAADPIFTPVSLTPAPDGCAAASDAVVFPEGACCAAAAAFSCFWETTGATAPLCRLVSLAAGATTDPLCWPVSFTAGAAGTSAAASCFRGYFPDGLKCCVVSSSAEKTTAIPLKVES